TIAERPEPGTAEDGSASAAPARSWGLQVDRGRAWSTDKKVERACCRRSHDEKTDRGGGCESNPPPLGRRHRTAHRRTVIGGGRAGSLQPGRDDDPYGRRGEFGPALGRRQRPTHRFCPGAPGGGASSLRGLRRDGEDRCYCARRERRALGHIQRTTHRKVD